MAKLLQEAEEQGILDVYLAKITRRQWLSVPPDRIGYPRHNRNDDAEADSETTVQRWTRLDGSKASMKAETLQDKPDCILQVCSGDVVSQMAHLAICTAFQKPPRLLSVGMAEQHRSDSNMCCMSCSAAVQYYLACS